MKNEPLLDEKAKKILADRAALMARKEREVNTHATSNLLVFYVGEDQQYALDYESIDKVILSHKITPVPGVNPLFSGLLYHNTEAWVVVNLHQLLIGKSAESFSHFILLSEDHYRIALSADTIVGQISYDETVELIQLTLSENRQSYVRGIYKNNIAILDKKSIIDLLNLEQVEWN
ncbi:chemotaxis protein CheW [Legionella quinlivanii]|uniref:chemotaxis protein CheW n=1 Tax=Legionella quinlivanii TaxID=45073 RepID=UPI002244863B|nr:chemotaxis protein CheW [Legionella quinlivanii]MCW8451568.1 chemotaxis protein CheW [Legionella quinlivanii]